MKLLPFDFDVDPVLATFFSILWDPGHFSDLAFTDVREGKIGNSKEFIARIIKRSNVFGAAFHSGKHLSELQMVAKSLDVRAHLVKSYSMTRFTSSSYSLLANIIESYSTYLEAFRKHQFDQIKDYMVSGYDYIIDLCSITDVMKPFVKMMILLQSLQYPCWKVVSWWKKVEVYLEGKNTDILKLAVQDIIHSQHNYNIYRVLTFVIFMIQYLRFWTNISWFIFIIF